MISVLGYNNVTLRQMHELIFK